MTVIQCAAAYLSICCEKLSFCSDVTRVDGKPGGCSISFNHTASREKQFLLRLKSTSANWSMRLRDAPPPMPWRRKRPCFLHQGHHLGQQTAASMACKRVSGSSSPPARPELTAFHLPAPPWLTEARLSSVVTVQSKTDRDDKMTHFCLGMVV